MNDLADWSGWEEWYAWRPVNLMHEYANCPVTAWLCPLMRKRVDGEWLYATPEYVAFYQKAA
jgi:hypothetical protein